MENLDTTNFPQGEDGKLWVNTGKFRFAIEDDLDWGIDATLAETHQDALKIWLAKGEMEEGQKYHDEMPFDGKPHKVTRLFDGLEKEILVKSRSRFVLELIIETGEK